MNDDFPELPDELNRKLNGIKPDPLPRWAKQQIDKASVPIWPKREIKQAMRRRAKARKERAKAKRKG